MSVAGTVPGAPPAGSSHAPVAVHKALPKERTTRPRVPLQSEQSSLLLSNCAQTLPGSPTR
eukprot:67957-Alexandrium_andersonii.AAC.1